MAKKNRYFTPHCSQLYLERKIFALYIPFSLNWQVDE